MKHILAYLILCITATAPRADTELLPRSFDFHNQFEQCVQTRSKNLYRTCQGVLTAGYTLRREIGYALQDCATANVEGCIKAFDEAGFPAKKLNIATLGRCKMINLETDELGTIDETYCIEHIARNIEGHSIPTRHSTDISCGINYIECAEIIDKGTQYWQETLAVEISNKLQEIPKSDRFSSDYSRFRYYSLLSQQHQQKIELAKTTCSILVVIPHWANEMDYRSCLGEAYADIWLALQDI